jgi:hypothetical protein
MTVPIFPNSSYFIAQGNSATFFEQIRLASIRHRARTYSCQSLEDFNSALSVIPFPSGLFIDGLALNEPILASVQQTISKLQKSPICYVTDSSAHRLASLPHVHTMKINANADAADWICGIDSFMKSLTPNGLDALMLDSAQSIMPRFFTEIGDFSRTPYLLSGADYQLNFSIASGDIVGQGLARIKWNDICQLVPHFNPNKDSEKILDSVRESMNQCLGFVIQRILRLYPQLNMRIGLPTGFDLLKIPEIQSTKYFPSVHISDNKRRFGISLGYFNLRNEPIFDLSGYTASQATDEVEFL